MPTITIDVATNIPDSEKLTACQEVAVRTELDPFF